MLELATVQPTEQQEMLDVHCFLQFVVTVSLSTLLEGYTASCFYDVTLPAGAVRLPYPTGNCTVASGNHCDTGAPFPSVLYRVLLGGHVV